MNLKRKAKSMNLKRLGIVILSLIGFLYAIWGYANGRYIRYYYPQFFVDNILLSSYSEIFVILIFGVWRISVEKNNYTRARLVTLVIFMATIFGMFPILLRTAEPFIGYLSFQPWFPAVHVPGAMMFFVWLALIFLFGRRIDCGWCCPCVAIRDTVGAPFRKNTLKGKTIWKLRHLKWFFVAPLVIYCILLFFPLAYFSYSFYKWFWMVIPLMYFASFLLIPLTGNRNYCRWLCPFGSLYGLLNKIGFYKIVADRDKCTDCKKCERECDMGIPIMTLVREQGEINVADCMGCGRCVTECPENVLQFRDVRTKIREKLNIFRRDT